MGEPQWRLLPSEYGKWNRVYKRFERWCEHEVWSAMLEYFADAPDMENVMVDSTVIRAHPSAAGAAKKRWTSRARFGAVARRLQHQSPCEYGLGNPLRLTGGEHHDITQAAALLEGYTFEYVLADRGYDADDFITFILAQQATPIILPKANPKTQREYDHWRYRERHLVECFMNKIKHYPRVFSRFDKLASSFLGFLSFLSTLIWLR